MPGLGGTGVAAGPETRRTGSGGFENRVRVSTQGRRRCGAKFFRVRPAREADDPGAANALSKAELLPIAAPTFTMAWLVDALNRINTPRNPKVQNAEGDAILFCTARFPITKGATIGTVRSALNAVAGLQQDNANFWNWVAAEAPSGRPFATAKQTQPDTHTFATALNDGLSSSATSNGKIVRSCFRPIRRSEWKQGLRSSGAEFRFGRIRTPQKNPSRLWHPVASLGNCGQPRLNTCGLGSCPCAWPRTWPCPPAG